MVSCLYNVVSFGYEDYGGVWKDIVLLLYNVIKKSLIIFIFGIY